MDRQVDVILLVSTQPGINLSNAGTGTGKGNALLRGSGSLRLGTQGGKAPVVERVWKWVSPQFIQGGCARQRMNIHVVIQAAILWLEPAHAPFIRIRLVPAFIMKRIMKISRAAGKDGTHIRFKPLSQVLI